MYLKYFPVQAFLNFIDKFVQYDTNYHDNAL